MSEKFQTLEEAVREHITYALRIGGNVSEAARLLDMPRQTLQSKMEKLGVRRTRGLTFERILGAL